MSSLYFWQKLTRDCVRLSECDHPLHRDVSALHTGHSGNHIFKATRIYSYVSLKCHDFVTTIDIIQRILPYISAMERLIN